MIYLYDPCGGTDDIFIFAGFFWFFAHFAAVILLGFFVK